MTSDRSRRASLASLLFFTSGATALTYQVVWFKRFSHVFGSSSLAMAGVVAGFLLGLGLGARLLGAWADHLRSPLRGYGACEVGIGLFALVVPFEITWLQGVTSTLHAALQPHPVLHALVRLAMVFFVLGPPCMLMGATLPLLVRQYASLGLGHATGWFYAINTAGAALGCYLTGFHLLPSFGLSATHAGAVALNLVVGVSAVALGRPVEGAGAERPDPGTPPRVDLGLRLAALCTGAGALMLQMVWMRQLALVLGGTTYAFTSVVLVVLVGIGAGSMLLRRMLRAQLDPRALTVAVTVTLVVTALVGQLALPSLAELVGALRDRRIDPGFNAFLCVGASAVLELLPSLAAGVLFPLLVHLTGARHGAEGRAVGRVYAWNTIGTTLGATVPNLVLFPLVGTLVTVGLALGVYLCVPLLAFRAERRPVGAGALLAQVGAALLVPILLPFAASHSIRYGVYLYGPESLAVLEASDVLFHREGPTCDVFVTRYEGQTNLKVNGKTDASTGVFDQVTQLGTAYLPRFLRPEASDICVIGFGSGATAGASLLFPTTRRVDCLEIEPAVFEASPHFASINHEPERFDAYHAIVDDGRSHVQSTERLYDLILTEPSNPWIAGISNLFTREFYVAVHERLEEGGMVGQWIQTYALAPADYALILRTVLDVFPHCALLWLDGANTMLLASDAPIVPPSRVLDAAQAMVDGSPAIQADLDVYLGGYRDVRSLVLQHLLLGEDGVRAWLADHPGVELNTDWNMRLEFDAPLTLFDPTPRSGERLTRDLLTAATPRYQSELALALEAGPAQARGFQGRARILALLGREDLAAELVRIGGSVAPEDGGLAADALLYDTLEDPDAFAEAAAALCESAPEEANRVALELANTDRLEQAMALARPLAERFPDEANLWANVGIFSERLGRLDEARVALRRALALAPADGDVRALLERIEGGDAVGPER